MILNKFQIKERIESNPAMVSNIKDLNLQLQPAALDLTIKSIYAFTTMGYIDFDNTNRLLSEKIQIKPVVGYKGVHLNPGVYQIEVNESFSLPVDVIGTTVSRSSLQRCGCSVFQGYFDPGFIGKGVVLLNVFNKHGLFLYKDARICQMVFHKIDPTESYNGAYQEVSK